MAVNMRESEPMMDGGTPQFGRLQLLDVRASWPDEARYFTPWLATAEGIGLLAQELGVELAVEGIEVAVGPYSADILARDLTSNALVVIENQLDKTDHDHLGKVLTYAAVLGATSVIWIARAFTEEHRKTLEWLNDLTKGDLTLYGVELQVWRIDDSRPSPRFEVVCRPNEIVRQAAMAREAEEFSDTRRLQFEFWTEVRRRLERSGRFRSLRTPRPQYWYDVALGRRHITLSLFANTWDKRIGVRIYLGREVADLALNQLLPMRVEIEQAIGEPLEWNPFSEKQDKIIRLMRSGDITDRAHWPELAEWITAKAVAFAEAFRSRIAALDLSQAPVLPEEQV
jgi:Domain of unknown function (DUF4268)